MINNALKSQIIPTYISKYATSNDLLSFSSINREMYFTKLNPKYNPIINTLYRELVCKKMYYSELIDEDDLKKLKTTEILDDYNSTHNNWKKIYLELVHHYHDYNYNNKRNCVKSVFERFQNHIYLPFIRKEIHILEKDESSLHLKYFYDFEKNKKICNHYDKYLDLENNGFFGQDPDNFIMRKNLFFETELLRFNELLRNVLENKDYIILLEKIINYDYEGIDQMYYRNKVNNEVFDFIIWLNHTAILFSKLLYSLIKIYFNEPKNKNELIIEYTKHHQNFVHFSLSINELFNNLNIIINYLYRFIKDKTKRYYEFSLYKMFFNIMKKEFYDKIKCDLPKKFTDLVEQFCKEINSNVNNERKSSFGSTKLASEDSFEENDEMEIVYDEVSMEEENKEITKKELIDDFMNCIVDLFIDEKNALCINHSKLKMCDDYIIYENILINTFVKEIDNSIIKEKNKVENIFVIYKGLLSMNEEYNKNNKLGEDIEFNFISRTKKLLFDAILLCLKRNLNNSIKEEFSTYINDNNKKNLIQNKKIMNYNWKELIDELDNEEKLKLENFYKETLDNIKIELENIIKANNNCNIIVNKSETINSYLEKENNDMILALKDILYSFYFDERFYSIFDNKIVALLNSDNNSNNLLS